MQYIVSSKFQKNKHCSLLILQHGCKNPSSVQAKGVMPGEITFVLHQEYLHYFHIKGNS